MKNPRSRLIVSLSLAALIVFLFKISFQNSASSDFETSKISPTPQEIKLYKELRHRDIPAKLHKHTPHGITIDIAIPSAKLNIEVDGVYHNLYAKQAMSDLKRTRYAIEDGYYTLRIPNSIVNKNLDETADLIGEIYEIRMEDLRGSNASETK